MRYDTNIIKLLTHSKRTILHGTTFAGTYSRKATENEWNGKPYISTVLLAGRLKQARKREIACSLLIPNVRRFAQLKRS